MRTDAQFLWDVIDAVDSIDRFLSNRSPTDFQADELLRSAVHEKLIIIGEAAGSLSDPLTVKYPAIPWRKIRLFRNAVIHGYFKINWDIIWGAATKDAPELRRAATEILAKEFPHFRPENT
jgi:uncharacterized protein with HEPN domain